MKKLLLASTLITIFSSCLKKMAQSSMVDPKDQMVMLKKEISTEVLNQLKETKTVFFYKNENPAKNDSIKAAVSSAWTLTPLIFDDISNFDKYASDPKFSYFAIEGNTTTYTTSTTGFTETYTHYYITLRLFKDVSKKGKINTTGLCRIELYPNNKTLEVGSFGSSSQVISKLYSNGVFYNWTPTLLKAQIGLVETNLANGIRPWLFENKKDENLASLLVNDTLYIPQNILMGTSAFSGKERDADENIFSKYKFKYRICTEAELYQIFETEKRGRFLFEYVRSTTDKFVSVYDVKSKTIVYKHYTPISYNLKSADIEAIK